MGVLSSDVQSMSDLNDGEEELNQVSNRQSQIADGNESPAGARIGDISHEAASHLHQQSTSQTSAAGVATEGRSLGIGTTFPTPSLPMSMASVPFQSSLAHLSPTAASAIMASTQAALLGSYMYFGAAEIA